MAAIGGMTAAIALIPMAAGIEKSRTTNQASTIRPMHVPISQKYALCLSTLGISTPFAYDQCAAKLKVR